MSDIKISFRCPGCEELISFPGTDAGTVQECTECGGWVDVPELTRSPDLESRHEKENERLWNDAVRQSTEHDRLLEMGRASHEEWRRQLEQSARYQDQIEKASHRFATLVERWEALTEKLEQALNKRDTHVL